MEYGWTGKIARVDLSTGDISTKDTAEYSEFIGGRGIAARIFFNEVEKGTDPFDPENRLILMTGPLTGTVLPGTPRIEVASFSPIAWPDPVWVRSSIGGAFGPEFKFAGFDGVILHGKAEKPSYLYLHDGILEIKVAGSLWGCGTFETQKRIAEIHGSDTQTACIGPAGENLVRDAVILHQTGHASGLGGFGAVMGVKNLKAIAVKGKGAVKVANQSGVMELVKYITSLIYNPSDPPGRKGCQGDFLMNWAGHEDSGEQFAEQYRTGSRACFACPMSCFPKIKIPGLETGSQICYWTIYGVFGAKSWRESWEIGRLADDFGVSMYGIANMRDWLLKLTKEGLITEKEMGFDIEDGGIDFYRKALPMIAHRQDFGDIMAEGLVRASERMNKGQENFIHHCGWSDKFVDPRESAFGVLSHATGTRIQHEDQYGSLIISHNSPPDKPPGDEDISRISKAIYGSTKANDPTSIPGKAYPTIHTQNYRVLMDSLTLCNRIFPFMRSGYGDDHQGDMSIHSRMFTAVTGIDLDEDALFAAGERIFNLERMLGVKYGYHSMEKDFKGMDERYFNEPLEHSLLSDKKINREHFIKEMMRYYELRGWDSETGIPFRTKLEELGLDAIADDLEI